MMAGGVAPTPRGRVLIAPPAEATLNDRQGLVLLALVLLLPLFGESFAYVIDLPPIYALAKLWPFVTLPLAAIGALHQRTPTRGLVLAAFAWMAGITPLISIATLGDSLGGALSGSIKVWPLLSALSLAALLAWLKPTAATLERTLHTLGFLTFALMGLIWLVAPPQAYTHGIEQTKVFLSDPERGLRLNVPMFFGLIWIFLLNRRFWAKPGVVTGLLILAAFALMAVIYKQRTQILGATTIVVLAPLLGLARRRGAWFGILAGAGLLALPVLLAVVQSHDATASLGGSLSIRQTELGHAVDYLNAAPLRWLIGAGGATRAGEVDLASIVGAENHYFFVSDLGWVGVLFEYGAIGAALMLALHLAAIRQGWRAAENGSPLAFALFDTGLYLLLVSPVLSVAFAPGELATCLALLAGLSARGRPAP